LAIEEGLDVSKMSWCQYSIESDDCEGWEECYAKLEWDGEVHEGSCEEMQNKFWPEHDFSRPDHSDEDDWSKPDHSGDDTCIMEFDGVDCLDALDFSELGVELDGCTQWGKVDMCNDYEPIECEFELKLNGDSWRGDCDDTFGMLNFLGVECEGSNEGDCKEMMNEDGYELEGLDWCEYQESYNFCSSDENEHYTECTAAF